MSKDKATDAKASEEQVDAVKASKSKKPKVADLLEEIEDLNILLTESKDKHLRLFAEFDNFKKRNIRERLDLLKNAGQDTLSAMLPIVDDFDRAKASAEDEKTEETLSEGVSMVYNKLYNVLEGKGLKKMVSNGEAFDPELHEAITKIPAPTEDMKGKVIDTIEAGFYLNEKIIRHAKVVVGE